jgi:DNA-binding transcriptional regulator YiaG
MATKHHETAPAKAKPVVIRKAKKQPRMKLVQATAAQAPSVAGLRKALGINRKLFARLTGYSERAVAKWESGTKLAGATLQKMNEISRLQQALATVIKPEFVPQWLQLPNDGFGGLKPIEVVERGEVDRLWHMVFELESGMPG